MRNALFLAFGIWAILAASWAGEDADFPAELRYSCSWRGGACREGACKSTEFATPDSCPRGILCCLTRLPKIRK